MSKVYFYLIIFLGLITLYFDTIIFVRINFKVFNVIKKFSLHETKLVLHIHYLLRIQITHYNLY